MTKYCLRDPTQTLGIGCDKIQTDTYWQQQKYKQYNFCCIVSRETMNKTQTQTMIKTKRSHEPIKNLKILQGLDSKWVKSTYCQKSSRNKENCFSRPFLLLIGKSGPVESFSPESARFYRKKKCKMLTVHINFFTFSFCISRYFCKASKLFHYSQF